MWSLNYISKCKNCLKLQKQRKFYGVSCWKNNWRGLIWDCIAFINTRWGITGTTTPAQLTSPSGHVYSRDTSIQGTHSQKNVHIIFVFVISISCSKPLFNQGNPLRILRSISVINRNPKLRLIKKKFKINKKLSNYKLIIVQYNN